MNAFVSTATSWVTGREIVPKFLIVQSVEQENTHRTDAPADHRGTDTQVKLENPEINKKRTKIFHNFQAVTTDVFIVQEIIRPQIVQQHSNGKLQPLTVLLVVQVPQYTKMHLTPHIHLLIPMHNHQPVVNTVILLYMYKRQPLTLTLHNFNLTYTKFLPHHLHKITKALITTPQFQSNLHQAPPPPLAQNNQSTNYHTNQQQMHTPPTQPFNAQLPQSFNPHVPPPYFP